MSSIITATRYHDISCGHRVAGHESKCAYLHGHNYRIHFTCNASSLDDIGRVLDFSVMKSKLCMWLEEHWDHKFLAWEDDQVMRALVTARKGLGVDGPADLVGKMLKSSIVWLPFNPTAENMADHLLRITGPWALEGTGVRLSRVVVEETRKCSASAEAS